MREHVFDLGWQPGIVFVILLNLFHRILRGSDAIKVKVASLEINDTLACNRKILRSDLSPIFVKMSCTLASGC